MDPATSLHLLRPNNLRAPQRALPLSLAIALPSSLSHSPSLPLFLSLSLLCVWKSGVQKQAQKQL